MWMVLWGDEVPWTYNHLLWSLKNTRVCRELNNESSSRNCRWPEEISWFGQFSTKILSKLLRATETFIFTNWWLQKTQRAKLTWTEAMQVAFSKLKEETCQDIELAYPDYSDEAPWMELWVDAFSWSWCWSSSGSEWAASDNCICVYDVFTGSIDLFNLWQRIIQLIWQ